jgi:lipopolysaccharide/colanic/teichoic acid biosynthesis glycosyltransferase
MRMRPPTSRGSFTIRFSAFDVIWAFISPWLALWIRGARVLSLDDWPTAAFYCAIAFIASLVAFLVFRIRDGLTHLFSVDDALAVAKAVFLSEFITYLILFSVTRLDGIPRSTPLIHTLLLSAGLIGARAFVRMAHSERDVSPPARQLAAENIIAIGSNRLTALYIDLLRAYAPKHRRLIAVLDDSAQMIGRSVSGIRVLGPPAHLLSIIEEFREHGVRTDRIIVGGDSDFLTTEAMAEIEGICSEYEIRLDFVPRLVGLSALQEPVIQEQTERNDAKQIDFSPSRYFQVKRYIDFFLSSLLIVIFIPVFLVVAALVLFDVGSPIFFWQNRIGMNGQRFRMHKFRTLKAAYDHRGQPVTTDRVSWVGALVRKLRLDELPQLLNVLVGDMSLIGPRPLLPHDQPADSTLRLMVHPGITGWAQVNGGKLLTPEEKNALDEWYVRNASLWLDIKIIAKTIIFMFGVSDSRHAQTAETKSTVGEQPDELALD